MPAVPLLECTTSTAIHSGSAAQLCVRPLMCLRNNSWNLGAALVLGLSIASCSATGRTVQMRYMSDECAGSFQPGVPPRVEWIKDALQVTYWTFDDVLDGSARLDSVSGNSLSISYQLRPHVDGEPMDMCGPRALHFTVRGIPNQNYSVSVARR
jgi:hypothetical protein